MKKTLTRRHFLKNSSLAAAGTALSFHQLSTLAPPTVKHLGLQLWSIREDMGKDAAGTVKALAGMGYREVEGFGYNDGKMFGMPIADFSKLLKDNGISMPSSHSAVTLKSYDEGKKSLTDATKKMIDDAASMGQRYVVCPWMDEKERPQIDKLVGVYQAAGEYARKAGLRFGYHNHNFEYEMRGPDNRLIIEWLLHETDPKLVAMEMDIYWVCFAKHNPLDWIKLYPGRWELCHAKDMANSEKRETIEVGDGSIDFNGIFKQSKLAGLQYYIIELEHYKTTPMQGVERARKNFMKLRF
ncbi:MAG: sugar phosphate isomerase/epimerase [Lewinellaceae bacterium]|nr:sugar phosphate isomerase/epimerase [Lewinellaceae bacterium]